MGGMWSGEQQLQHAEIVGGPLALTTAYVSTGYFELGDGGPALLKSLFIGGTLGTSLPGTLVYELWDGTERQLTPATSVPIVPTGTATNWCGQCQLEIAIPPTTSRRVYLRVKLLAGTGSLSSGTLVWGR